MNEIAAKVLVFLSLLLFACHFGIRAKRWIDRRRRPIPPCLVCGADLEFVPEDDQSSGRGVFLNGVRGWWLCERRAAHHRSFA